MPDLPINQPVAVAKAVIHGAMVNVAASAAIAAAVAAAPWLGLPIINTIFTWAARYAFGFFSKFMEQGAADEIIDVQENAQASEASKAKVALHNTIVNGGSKDDQEKAIAAFEAAYAKLIKFDGV